MKKLFSMAAAVIVALTSIMFSSCERQQKSSYQFGYEIAADSGCDDALATMFMLSEDGYVVIYNEMKKTADQCSDAARTCIWKNTRDNAVKAAKKAFQAGMEAVRKDNASFKGIVIQLYMFDPDTNAKVNIEKATI